MSVCVDDCLKKINEILGDDTFSIISPHLDILIKSKSIKRKRNKHQIPLNERCIAKKSGGEQCTRRKKNDSHFCGTHIKGTPHGQTTDIVNNLKKVHVFAEDIDGIIYYIDDDGNVYNSEDIYNSLDDPRIISKYIKDVNGKLLLVN
ncbi:hypothetical protein N9231_05625 [Saprospiraceae bacterium]|nr:hypothetical protein [Saprospiraceae bacterium]